MLNYPSRNLLWPGCLVRSTPHATSQIQYWRGSGLFWLVSLAAPWRGFSSTVQLEADVGDRFEGGWSRVWEERCPASCSRMRFLEVLGGLWSTGGCCDASIRLAFDMAGGATKELTFLPVGTLLIGGEGGVRISRVRLFLDANCLPRVSIACKRAFLRTAAYFLIPRGCFPTDRRSAQKRKCGLRVLHLDPLVLVLPPIILEVWLCSIGGRID